MENKMFDNSPANNRSRLQAANQNTTTTLSQAGIIASLESFRDRVTKNMHHPVLLGLMLALVTSNARLNAQSTGKEFVPFQSFVESTKLAPASDYTARKDRKVKDSGALEEMRQHILNLYQGVEVSHSFVLGGDHYDCVPTQQQPAVRMFALKNIATPPPTSLLMKASNASSDRGESAQQPKGIASQLGPGDKFDEFGNSRVCEDNSIPMRRVTLEEVSRFATLKNYLEKGPGGAGHAPRTKDPSANGPVLHKYSYTYQYVNNIGQTDTINLWDPYVNTGLGEIFSLAQSWTIAYSPVLQTDRHDM